MMVAICYKLHRRLGTSLVMQSLRASHIPAQLPLKMTTHHIFNGQDGEVRKKTEIWRKVWLEIYSIRTEELTSLYKPQIDHPNQAEVASTAAHSTNSPEFSPFWQNLYTINTPPIWLFLFMSSWSVLGLTFITIKRMSIKLLPSIKPHLHPASELQVSPPLDMCLKLSISI